MVGAEPNRNGHPRAPVTIGLHGGVALDEIGNRGLIGRYLAAEAASDWDMLAKLRAPDWVEEWPQSGERIRGHDNYRAIHERFPGGMAELDIERVVGSDDRWTVSPLFTPVKVLGSGEFWAMEGRFRYPNGEEYVGVKHLELRDGRVVHETTYWAAPFAAPAWRRPWVELEVARDAEA